MGWDHKGIIWIFHQGDHTAAHLAKPFETSGRDAFTGAEVEAPAERPAVLNLNEVFTRLPIWGYNFKLWCH